MKRLFALLILSGFFLTAFPLNAAVNQNQVKKIVLIKEQENGYTFGIAVKNVDSQTLQKYKLSGGAEVVKVEKGSAAEKAGLKVHDIIIKFDGAPIHEPEDLAQMIDEIDEQKTIDVVVFRDGKELILTAKINPEDVDHGKDDEEAYEYRWPWRIFGMMADSMPDFDLQIAPFLKQFSKKGGYLGVIVDNLTDQLLEYFKADYGVLVKQVAKNSPAEKAGIKAGDVIYKINDKKIKDAADLVRTVQYYDPGDKITVYFIRNGKKKSVTVILGKKEGREGWPIFPGFWFDRNPGSDHHFRMPFMPPKSIPRFYRTPQERERGIYKF